MSFLKITFAAAVVAALSLTAFGAAPASAKPIFQPVNPAMQPIGKGPGGCGKGWVGCNPNTWTPGHSGGYGGIDVSLTVVQPAVAADGDCYYVRRKVLVPNIGIVRERVLVCD